MPKEVKKTKQKEKSKKSSSVKKTASKTKEKKASSSKAKKEKKTLEEAKIIWTSAKRKTARTRLMFSSAKGGGFLVNKKAMEEYFYTPELQAIVRQPFQVIGKKEDEFSFKVEAKGGGLMAQAQAVRRAIALALSYFNPEWKPLLKKAGFLTSDARIKERKKPGLKRARRAPQWQKR